MSRYQVKPREDGRGPYRWSHVVKNPMGGALRQGSIYRQMGDDLGAEDTEKLRALCDENGFEMRRVS
jgi:hypothetical protein